MAQEYEAWRVEGLGGSVRGSDKEVE
jgi:hypothetical protein